MYFFINSQMLLLKYCYNNYLYESGFGAISLNSDFPNDLFSLLLFMATLTLEILILISFLFFYHSNSPVFLLLFSLFSFQFLILKMLFSED